MSGEVGVGLALKPQPFRKVLFRPLRAQTISVFRGFEKQRMTHEAASESEYPEIYEVQAAEVKVRTRFRLEGR
jgi:hypothetical protein